MVESQNMEKNYWNIIERFLGKRKNSLQSEFEDVLYVPSQYGGYSCI